MQELLKDKEISVFYCSPYRRSLDTIRLCAEQYHMEIFEFEDVELLEWHSIIAKKG